MYYSAELVIRNYNPEYIEAGMLFLNALHPGTAKESVEIYALNKRDVPRHEDKEEFIQKHGFPLKLYIVDIDDWELAYPEQIGWFDPGDDSDEYRDIELKDINMIMNEHAGFVEIEIKDEDHFFGAVNPVIEEGKVIIRPL